MRSVWQQSESTPRLNGQQALKSRQLESRSSPTSLKVCYFILFDCWSCSGEFCREKEGEKVVSRDGCLVCIVDDPSCSLTETDQLDAQMPFVKTVKSNAYFSRFQVKYRRRREGKTDCKQPNSSPKKSYSKHPQTMLASASSLRQRTSITHPSTAWSFASRTSRSLCRLCTLVFRVTLFFALRRPRSSPGMASITV